MRIALLAAVTTLGALALPSQAAGPAVQLASVEVRNPSEFARADQWIELPFSSLGIADGYPGAKNLVVEDRGKSLPVQLLDMNRDGAADLLLTVLDLEAAAAVTLAVTEDAAKAGQQSFTRRTQAELSHKRGGRWEGRKYIGGEWTGVNELTPPPQHTDHSEFIRYEGPGIESDRVGYRVYLDERNGFDIFGKRVAEPVLHKVGLDGFASYHEPADWGMDILKVGPSLGIGGYGYWREGKVERVSDVEGWTASVRQNGALQSQLGIHYKQWQVAGKKIDLDSSLTMRAGQELVHVRLKSSEPLDNIAAGLVRHEGTQVLTGEMEVTGDAYTYLATWGPQSLDGGNLGMAVLFQRRDLRALDADEFNHVAVLEPRGDVLEYFFLAAWDGAENGIDSAEAFKSYLEQKVEMLTIEPRVSVRSGFAQQQKRFPVSGEEALRWARQLADSEIARHGAQLAWGGWDELRERPSNWEYSTGLLMQAYDDLGLALGKPQYNALAQQVISSYVAADGSIHSYDMAKYNIDSVNSGKMLLRLYARSGEERYRKAAALLREQLASHPRLDNGAYWHKQRYPYQLWLDGVYMATPFLAEYAVLFEGGASLEDAVTEFTVARDELRDPQTGLYWHAFDEKRQQVWADPQSGRSKYFWARGLGWLAMALVDTLDYIPADHPEQRQVLIDMTRDLADTLLRFRSASGTWYQILDMPDAPGNYRESSASSMFTYMLAKGVNEGILPEQYRAAAVASYEGLLREFVEPHPDGSASLTHNCAVAGLGFGRDGSYHYYMSERLIADDPKGLAPFIFASIEIAKLLD